MPASPTPDVMKKLHDGHKNRKQKILCDHKYSNQGYHADKRCIKSINALSMFRRTESFHMDNWDVDLKKLEASMKKLKIEKKDG